MTWMNFASHRTKLLLVGAKRSMNRIMFEFDYIEPINMKHFPELEIPFMLRNGGYDRNNCLILLLVFKPKMNQALFFSYFFSISNNAFENS